MKEALEEQLDRLSLTQALVDAEMATARVIDLTERLVDAREQIVNLRSELEHLRIEYTQYRAEAGPNEVVGGVPIGRPNLGGAQCPRDLSRPGGSWSRSSSTTARSSSAPACRRWPVSKPGSHSADVLVLDDASPAPGWSDRCREMATDLGFGYYRTPRNLGIPRNMNLGMLRAVDAGYDAVILLNSDTIVPSNLIPTLIRPLIEDASISSTTAWSNNSSVYSIPNSDPDHLADDPKIIDWISERLDEEFDGQAIPIPSGVGFCMVDPDDEDRRSGAHGPGLRSGLLRRDRLVSPQPYAWATTRFSLLRVSCTTPEAESRKQRASSATVTARSTHTKRSSTSAIRSTPRSSLRSRPRASSTACGSAACVGSSFRQHASTDTGSRQAGCTNNPATSTWSDFVSTLMDQHQ